MQSNMIFPDRLLALPLLRDLLLRAKHLFVAAIAVCARAVPHEKRSTRIDLTVSDPELAA